MADTTFTTRIVHIRTGDRETVTDLTGSARTSSVRRRRAVTACSMSSYRTRQPA